MTAESAQLPQQTGVAVGAQSARAQTSGLFFVDRDWRFTFMNANGETYLGQSAEALQGKLLWLEFASDSDSDNGTAYRAAMDYREVTTVRAFYPLTSRWLDSTSYPTLDGIAVYLVDVTDDENTAISIRAIDAQMRRQSALLDAARDIILVFSVSGRIDYVNSSARQLFGEGVDGQSELDTPRRLGLRASDFEEARSAVLENGSWDGSFLHHFDGRVDVVTAGRWQVVMAADGTPDSILAVHTDETLEREREAVHIRAQRLESLGTLAGGIAHDLNNVLTPILMAAQLLQAVITEPSHLTLITSIEISANRGSDMIRRLLTFARGSDGTRRVIDPRVVLDDVVKLCEETLPKDIELHVELGELEPISADSTQILQVLLNFVTNARDAMPDGGELTISARALEVASSNSSLSHLVSKRCVVVSVSDVGEGIAPEVAARMFEPFFTTKGAGDGTGLGLATSAAIIRSHGGAIVVDTVVGEGSTFSIYLPMETSADLEVEADAGNLAPPRGAGELVLIVDDEEAIRLTVREALRGYGYRTIEASDGREAIEAVERSAQPVRVVFSDMMMPVMDGAALADHLAEHFPDVVVVAASGLSTEGEHPGSEKSTIRYFVPKPFSVTALLTAIGRAMDDAAHRSRTT